MADAETGSPLEAAVGATESHATEAFSLLGNETRLAILVALWELHEPGSDDTAASFSELYERIDYDNPGNFRYHLEQLEGQFIRRGPDGDGYELRNTGLEFVQTVIAGAGIQDTRLEPTEIDRRCPLCDAPTAVSYADGTIYQLCTECDGRTSRNDLPDGWLNGMKFDPAGLTGRSPDELMAAAEIAAYRHMRTMFEGLCSSCSGPVEASLDICPQHDAEGVCRTCGREPAYTAQFRCRVCKDFHGTTPAVLTVFHPAVVAFYYEHGISPRWHADEYGGHTLVGDDSPEYETALVSEDPPRLDVTIRLDDDELRVTFDETVTVVDVEW